MSDMVVNRCTEKRFDRRFDRWKVVQDVYGVNAETDARIGGCRNRRQYHAKHAGVRKRILVSVMRYPETAGPRL